MRFPGLLTTTLVVVTAWSATRDTPVDASDIRSDEEVIFFPTAAHLDETDGEWVIPIHGWIFEPETGSLRRRAGLAALRIRLKLDPDEAATRVLEERLGAFIVDNERGKRLEITVGDDTFPLAASDDNGRIHDVLRLPRATAESLSDDGWLTFAAVTRRRDERQFVGRVRLVSPRGLSVISDIDDTLKVSNVTDKEELLRRTFCEGFEAVEGMVSLLDSWKASDAAFHFVSSSPWQLYPALSEFFAEVEFPQGSWHLKDVGVDDSSLLNLFSDPFEYKLVAIEELLARYPERNFVLVGDSGEQDPEVYGELARRHPDQVSRILIRLASEDTAAGNRFGRAFRDVPRDRWTVFDDPEQLDFD